MKKWTEIRTAYRLAKLGTLSSTASDLGIHRSSVMRHIDALEEDLQIKLFQRNNKGYIPTEAGLKIMQLGEITDTQFTLFANKTKNNKNDLEGLLKITCIDELSQFLFPSIIKYQHLYPKVKINIIGSTKKYNLEYGDADIAIRTGDKPKILLDNIVIPFIKIKLAFCAHQKYIKQYGSIAKDNFTKHKFIAQNVRLKHLPWNEWIHSQIPEENKIITCSSQKILDYAIHSGCGIGIANKDFIENDNHLIEIETGNQWEVATWILVHQDIINIPKIRAFIDILKGSDL